jgi:hypothetical protein
LVLDPFGSGLGEVLAHCPGGFGLAVCPRIRLPREEGQRHEAVDGLLVYLRGTDRPAPKGRKREAATPGKLRLRVIFGLPADDIEWLIANRPDFFEQVFLLVPAQEQVPLPTADQRRHLAEFNESICKILFSILECRGQGLDRRAGFRFNQAATGCTSSTDVPALPVVLRLPGTLPGNQRTRGGGGGLRARRGRL